MAPDAVSAQEDDSEVSVSLREANGFMLVAALAAADLRVLPVVFPYIKGEFHLSDFEIGLLASMTSVVGGLALLGVGPFVDRLRRTHLIAWTTAIWSGFMILCGLATSYVVLFGFAMFLRVAEAGYQPATFSLVGDYYPVEHRGRIFGRLAQGSVIALAMGPIAGAIAVAWGWRATFVAFAIPGFLLAIRVSRFGEPPRGVRESQHLGVDRRESDLDDMSTLAAFGYLLRIKTVRYSVIAFGLQSIFFLALGTWNVTFWSRYHGLSVAGAATLGLPTGLALAGGALVGGRISDALAEDGKHTRRAQVGGLSMLIISIGLVIGYGLPGAIALCIGVLITGAFIGGMYQPVVQALIADVVHPSVRGRASSLLFAVTLGAGAFSPLLVGWLSDVIGLRGAIELLSPFGLLAGLTMLFVAPRYVLADMTAMRRSLGEENPDLGRRRFPTRLAAEGTALIQAHQLYAGYNGVPVVRDVSIEVGPGEIVALLGPNGAGKSTTIMTMAGALPSLDGRVVMEGQVARGSLHTRAKNGLGLVPEQRAVIMGLSARDNLWIGQGELTEALRLFPELEALLPRRGGLLSGGEQQILTLARALAAEPRVLLVDELSLGLAPLIVSRLFSALRQAADERQMGVLLVEQHVGQALKVADYAYVMQRGRIEMHGPASDIAERMSAASYFQTSGKA